MELVCGEARVKSEAWRGGEGEAESEMYEGKV